MTRNGKGVYSAKEGMEFSLGEIDIEIVASYFDSDNENNRSLIIKALLDGKSFLFLFADDDSYKTGDHKKEINPKHFIPPLLIFVVFGCFTFYYISRASKQKFYERQI